MKVCSKCGQAIPDNSKFCSACGEVVEEINTQQVETPAYIDTPAQEAPKSEAPKSNREEEQKCLDGLYSRLKWERLAWKISGIFYIVMAAFFMLYGAFFAVLGGALIADSGSYVDEYYEGEYYDEYYDSTVDGEDFFATFSLAFGLSYGITFMITLLPIGIVNLVMTKKVGKYREKVYTDCTDGYNHATSVGSIVLGAIFNNVALVFIIVNFILTKNNKETFDRIKANQSAYNNRQY